MPALKGLLQCSATLMLYVGIDQLHCSRSLHQHVGHVDAMSDRGRPSYRACQLPPICCRKELQPVDKETLAVIFGLTKFHQFVYGRHFNIKTDHKLVLELLSQQKSLSQGHPGCFARNLP